MGYAGTWNDIETTRARRRRDSARARIDRLARLLDSAIRIPGTGIRLGLDPILGLAPGVGDALGMCLALWIVYEAYRIGAPRHLMARMLANIAVDTLVGTVPVLGDLFDVAFKANIRNRDLLRRHMGL